MTLLTENVAKISFFIENKHTINDT